MGKLRENYVGNRAFYRMLLMVAVPIIIQNGITNFVSLLDNLMVGQVGTEQMSGVSIVNQLMFVFNICIFGAVSGAGIFTAQFFGKGDMEGVRDTLRYKILCCLLFAVLGIVIFIFGGKSLISLYLHDGGETGDIAATLAFGEEYLGVMLIGLLPFAVSQAYSSTLRETGETVMPMKAGLAAVFVNLILNYLLIYGKLGFPELGVGGAAAATVVSRYVETVIIVLWTHRHTEKNRFILGVYRSMRIPGRLIRQIVIKGLPLMANEMLWSIGMAAITQCYSTRGLAAVAGLNISSTISNLFNVVFIAMGSALSIIVGQQLGAGKLKEARESDTKIIFAAVACCLVIGSVMAATSELFPFLYNTTDEVRGLAAHFIRILAFFMPFSAFMHCSYFTLRSGGKTFVTFLFDSVYLWCVSLPVAFLLSRFTGISVVWLFLLCQIPDLVKCVIGYFLVKRGSWAQNFVRS